ncbi:MAG: undecaprenyl-diphosphatase [Chloroflexia bacterium]|nr:undecaprenyl-diphosphatase [Chloroflexia bacterium]
MTEELSSASTQSASTPMLERPEARFNSRFVLIFGALVVLSLVTSLAVVPNWGKVLALGVVEGVTEFLPISSTAHLIITAEIINFQDNIGGTFEIFIQLGAVLAVIAFFMRQLLAQARSFAGSPTTRRFWSCLAIASVPAAAVGFAFRSWIKQILFGSPAVLALAMIAGGIILIVVERIPQHVMSTQEVEHMTYRQAVVIGIAQTAAVLIPGISRSGASIVGGMLSGLNRPTATVFSFYLAIPTLGGATIFDLVGSLDQVTPDDVSRLLVGTFVAFVVSWVAIGWLLNYVASHSFRVFGIYRIIAGTIILILIGLGWL